MELFPVGLAAPRIPQPAQPPVDGQLAEAMQRARDRELSTADLVASAERFDVPRFLEALRAALDAARYATGAQSRAGAGARP